MSTLKTINVIHPAGTTNNIVNDNLGNVTVGNNLAVVGTATFGSTVTAPIVIGGNTASSTLTLQSTSGLGTSDSITLKVGSSGATTALSVATTGIVSFPTTGAVVLPAGTTVQEPTGQAGMLRFNTTSSSFEGYNGAAWGSIGGGGGATGGGGDQAFWENQTIINNSFTIGTGKVGDWNAGTFGPITVAAGATITVPAGSTWSIV